MAYTDINRENRLVQKTFAHHLQKVPGWLYAFGPYKRATSDAIQGIPPA